jgi:beta-lactamase class A
MHLLVRRLTIVGALMSSLVAPTIAGAQRPDTIALHRTLDSLTHRFHGVLGYAINNLDTGERFTMRGDETFPTASLIKVAVLVTLYDLAEKGMLSLDDQLTLLKIDQVPGSGVLQYMHPGMTLSVRDAAVLMSILSDNTATNLLLDKIVIRRVWQKMEALGLPHTKVHSKVFLRIASVAVDSSAKYGLGVTTPNEMARLFDLMANGKAVNAKADSAMLDILANNQDMEQMQRTVSGLAVPHKTGATDSVRTECALFRLQSRVVACALTKQNADTRWVVDNEAQLAVGRIGEAILKTWPRKQERADDSR